MPLLSITHISEYCRIGLWVMTESIEELYLSHIFLKKYRFECNSRFKSDGRKREFLSIRALLCEMTGNSDQEIKYKEDGSPYLDDVYCSISHTRGYAALMLSNKFSVAIDIEYKSDRVNKVLDKFIRPDEQADDLIHRLIHWSAKETFFKLYHEDNLEYFDMRITPFNLQADNLLIENMHRYVTQRIYFKITDDFVLTYAIKNYSIGDNL